MFWGGVNMRKAQIYIKKTLKTEKITLSWGVSSLNWGGGGQYPPRGGGKNITALNHYALVYSGSI